MAKVFILYRETFWNDIDHTEWFDVWDVFSSQEIAKAAAQKIYNREHPNRRYPDVIENTLKWVDSSDTSGIITQIEGIDEDHDECGNFVVIEHEVKEQS